MALLKTGVDRLVDIIREKKRISISSAAKQLGIDVKTVQELADFLEEEKIIDIQYTFATPFLVSRAITPEKIDKKAGELKNQKQEVMKKIENSIQAVDLKSEAALKTKAHLKKLASEIKNVAPAKNELKILEKAEESKKKLDTAAKVQQMSFKEKLSQIGKKIGKAQKQYADVLNIKKPEEIKKVPNVEKVTVAEHHEEKIAKRLEYFGRHIAYIELSISKDKDAAEQAKQQIAQLKKLYEETKNDFGKAQSRLSPALKSSAAQEKLVRKMQAKILSDVLKRDGLSIKSKVFSVANLRMLFLKRNEINVLITRISAEECSLKQEIDDLSRRAALLKRLSMGSTDMINDFKEVEGKYAELSKKKASFESELKMLTSIIKIA